MRKTILLAIILLAFTQVKAQDINIITIDEKTNKEILIGEVNEEGLVNPVFVENWQESYDNYSPKKKTIKKLKKYFKKNEDISVNVFLATWCHDSQIQLPDFLKIAHLSNLSNIQYYALNTKKEMDEFDYIDVYSYNIELVPTFIVYRDNKEIGRIIESPKETLEEDLYEILKK